MACADAALEDYRKASLLLRLPGSIDIPSFEDEILAMESSRSSGSPSISDMDDSEEDIHHHHPQSRLFSSSTDVSMGNATPSGVMSPASILTANSSPNPSINGSRSSSSIFSTSKLQHPKSASKGMIRQVIDVPLVVRKAINTREDVLRSLGVDEETIKTKKMVLVSFGGQRLKQGWGNPLPEGWIGVICGLPVEHELPKGFYRSPHGVYVPDLTEAADIVIGKLVRNQREHLVETMGNDPTWRKLVSHRTNKTVFFYMKMNHRVMEHAQNVLPMIPLSSTYPGLSSLRSTALSR